MKIKLLLLIVLAVLLSNVVLAQYSDEAVIRKLENAEREAILNGDTSILYKLMSKKIVVQNPENTIVGFREILERVKAGKISYASFERNIERDNLL